ncbi:MAG: hypothetical protein DCF14_24985, partial [Phormidesmis priestleyi]
MSGSLQVLKPLFKLSRRRFNQLTALAAISILAGGLTSCSDAPKPPLVVVHRETYHIFIGNKLVQEGGEQTVTLKSGIIKTISISRRTTEKTETTLKNAALDGGDAIVILHTLYDPQIEIDGVVEQAILSTPLLKATHDRCRDVYHQVKKGDRIRDPQALDVLDTIVSGSSKIRNAKNGNLIQQRYRLASQNSRLVELQTYLEVAVDRSEIPPERKQQLKGIYQYVRAGEALPSVADLDALTAIDAIVQGSTLPVPLRQRYAFASAQTRAFTADEAIQNLIRSSHHAEGEAGSYLETYNRIWLGLDIKNQVILTSLNLLIDKSNLPPEVKTIYKLAHDRFFNQNKQLECCDVEGEKSKSFYGGM